MDSEWWPVTTGTLILVLQSGYLGTLYSCDDCRRRVPISCVRRQASDPWLTLTTVGESGDGALPEPLPDFGLSVMWSWSSVGRRYSWQLLLQFRSANSWWDSARWFLFVHSCRRCRCRAALSCADNSWVCIFRDEVGARGLLPISCRKIFDLGWRHLAGRCRSVVQLSRCSNVLATACW